MAKGGRGGRRGGGSGSHTFEAGNLTESEFDKWSEDGAQDLESWVNSKSSESIEKDGWIFEKMTTQKEVRSWLDYADEYIPDDDAWAFKYKDGTVEVYGSGDSVRDIKKTGIETAIYSNASTTMIYGSGVEFYNNISYAEYKKGYTPQWQVDLR